MHVNTRFRRHFLDALAFGLAGVVAVAATDAAELAVPVARMAQLRAAVAPFNGEWVGAVTIKSPDGASLRTVEARQETHWDGQEQVTQLHVELGSQTYIITRRLTFDSGQIQAWVQRPRQEPRTYTGMTNPEGIRWMCLENPRLEYEERLVQEGRERVAEFSSLEPLHAGGISGLVWLEGRLRRVAGEDTVAPGVPGPPPLRGDFATAAGSGGEAGSDAEERAVLRARLEAIEAELARLRGSEVASLGDAPVNAVAAPAAPVEAVAAMSGDVTEAVVIAEPEVAPPPAPPPPPPPGAIRVLSDPVGATVEVDGRIVGETPMLVTDVEPGRRLVVLRLAGRIDQSLELDVEPGRQADAGTVSLDPAVGAMMVASDPAGLPFQVRSIDSDAADAPSFLSEGETPAKVEGIPVGRYVVQVRRESWPLQEREITVEAAEVAEAVCRFVGGSLMIKSRPAGAEVLIGGVTAGTTPLLLKDLAPGVFSARVQLRGFQARELEVGIEADRPSEVSTELERVELVTRVSDLEVRPAVVQQVAPEVDGLILPEEWTVHLGVIVGRDGVPREIELVKCDHEKLGERCRRALAQWRFSPGIIAGEPVAVKVIVPFRAK